MGAAITTAALTAAGERHASGLLEFEAYQQTPYFNALDGLRGISIGLVLLHHVPSLQVPFLELLQRNARYGVDLFFVISGYLICTLFLREERRWGKIDLWRFYGRRSLRLMPLYYAVLLGECILIFGLNQYSPQSQALFKEKLPAYLLYYSNWLSTATQGPFFQSWSLAVEEQFYVAFGLLFLFWRRAVWWVVGALVLAKVVLFNLSPDAVARLPFSHVLFSYREPILLGVLAGFLMNRKASYEALSSLTRHPLAFSGVALAAFGWVCIHSFDFKSGLDAQALYLLMVLVIIGCVSRPDVFPLTHPWLLHLGKLSYAIYLLHMMVINVVKRGLGGHPLTLLVVSSAGLILVASLVNRYFEEPIIRFYKKRLSR
jgi:peptidoglycan/LPS O-acetylase OafA/YrhL